MQLPQRASHTPHRLTTVRIEATPLGEHQDDVLGLGFGKCLKVPPAPCGDGEVGHAGLVERERILASAAVTVTDVPGVAPATSSRSASTARRRSTGSEDRRRARAL